MLLRLGFLVANNKIIPVIFWKITSTVHRVVKLRKGSYINILQIIYKEEIRQSADKEYGGRYLLTLQCRSKIIANEHTEHVSHTMFF